MEAPQHYRCINIDWLEVFCIEDPDHSYDPSHFEQAGYQVHVRSYGTPQYRQMFFLVDEGRRLFEIRREPLSLKKYGGIFDEGACHIRLTNYACYLGNAVSLLSQFIIAHHYTFKNISRIDLALDFTAFDNQLLPPAFITDFMLEKYQKINQVNISAHGTDKWQARAWNSLKWGAPTSAVTTKLYNKSLELKQQHDKPYIRQVWEACGLDPLLDVWRVEFSVSPSINFVASDTEKVLIPRSLSAFYTRDQQYFQWSVLAQKYFVFVFREYTRSGQLKPKRRCTPLSLFKFTGRERFYKPEHLVYQEELGRTHKIFAKRLFEMSIDKRLSAPLRRCCETICLHLADTYVSLDFVRQLEVELLHLGEPSIKVAKDLETLREIRDRYSFNHVRPKLVRHKDNYLLFE